jgi:PAS domain S-box-containing protein
VKKIQILSIFFAGLGVTALIHIYFIVQANRNYENELTYNTEQIKKELEHTINIQINAVSDLRAFMLANDALPNFNSFDRFARNVLETHPTITSTAYVDSNRIIRHFYPLQGNAKAIGLDLMTRPAAPYVDKAIRKRIVTVNHPTMTVQGKLSIIVRAPLFHENEFRGLVQGILEVKTILDNIDYKIDKRIGYTLEDINGKQFAKNNNPIAPTKEATIIVGDNHWIARVGWSNNLPEMDPLIIILIWGLGTLLNLTITSHFYRTSTYAERISREVTNKTFKLKHAYEELSNQTEQYRSLVESSSAIPWEVDIASFCFTFVGKQAETILGYPVEEWYEDGFWLNHIHTDDQDFAMSFCKTETSQSRDHEFEYRMYAADGSIVWLRDHVRVIKENGIPVRLQGFMFDITARKNAEENLKHAYENLEEKVLERTTELVKAKEEAIKANRAKTHFLSRMSHELRTPLNAIMGFSQLLMQEDSLDNRYKEDIREILNAAQHLLELINEVLDLSHIETGIVKIKPENVILLPILDEITALMKPIADERGITLNKDYEIDKSITVISEKTRLKEVLLNLISNAIKYNIDNGSVTIKCVHHGNHSVRISIIDTGTGLDAEERQQIFEPFNRLGAEYKQIEGTGIGLNITNQLIKLMDSNLIVESTPGKGSCFYFDLKLAE